MSDPPPLIQHVRAAFGRYLRARREDLLGRPGAHRDAGRRLDRMIDALADRPADRSAAPSAPAWQRRYAADAAFVRAFLSAAVVAALIGGHRVWLADWAGAGASLGMAFTLAGLALAPAYRCWRIRSRPPGAVRWFVRHPTAWWPPPLPADDGP
ncbi:MAG TPA: hypothetical protein PLJ20_00175 [Candidatus Contendobacter sp.]|nr:hypothetical protein [Candidatus Contendobacter sp.]